MTSDRIDAFDAMPCADGGANRSAFFFWFWGGRQKGKNVEMWKCNANAHVGGMLCIAHCASCIGCGNVEREEVGEGEGGVGMDE